MREGKIRTQEQHAHVGAAFNQRNYAQDERMHAPETPGSARPQGGSYMQRRGVGFKSKRWKIETCIDLLIFYRYFWECEHLHLLINKMKMLCLSKF